MNNLTKAVKAALQTGSPATSVGSLYKSWVEANFLGEFLSELEKPDGLNEQDMQKVKSIILKRSDMAGEKLFSALKWAEQRESEEAE